MIHAVFADEQEVARRAGVPLEGIAAAVRGGGLSLSYLDVAAFDRFAGLSGTTFQELSHQTGIPLELLAVVREAFGFAEPEPQDQVRRDELSVVAAIRRRLAAGFGPGVIEHWLRVSGDSLRRIGETETAGWRSQVEGPLLASGMTGAEMLTAQAELGSQLAPWSSRPRWGSTTASRNTPGSRISSRASRGRWRPPGCTAGWSGPRRWPSWTSPATRG
jgi:hypothetical protein